MNTKKQHALRQQFHKLTRAQLVALSMQRTDVAYITARNSSKDALIDTLMGVPGALKPVQA